MHSWRTLPPLAPNPIRNEHGSVLTGHWEFDLAIALVFFAVIAYSFLLPADAPKGLGRIVIQMVAALFFLGAVVMAVVGFRSL